MADVDDLIRRINQITPDDWKLPHADQIVHVRHTLVNLMVPLTYLLEQDAERRKSDAERKAEVRRTMLGMIGVALTVAVDIVLRVTGHGG